MTTRRDAIKTVLVAGVAASILGVKNAMTTNSNLTWKHFPAGEQGFFRAPVLIFGERDAVLIDGGFTLPDGKALAEAIKNSGKTLTTIYISQSDPDYYFSLLSIKAAFPEAKVIAASATIAAIKGSVEAKLATWGPQLKENGPQTLADVVMPEAFDNHLSVWKATPSRLSMPTVLSTAAISGCLHSTLFSAACWCFPVFTYGPLIQRTQTLMPHG
jgi:hypothetical protein